MELLYSCNVFTKYAFNRFFQKANCVLVQMESLRLFNLQIYMFVIRIRHPILLSSVRSGN
jgi:hypothetical protein